ncbi:hypothetical protein BJX63DRAFT_437461 [Aspergillus granulosus]|uniref:NACHT domain-containing protein n=1 Tax=Aspergillus granulosus TaxID=176169 RepID=A0ABR4GUW9_9EURO
MAETIPESPVLHWRDVAIVYIYCDYKSQEKQRTVLLLSNLLKQALMQIEGPVPEFIEALYLKCRSGNLCPTIHKLLQSCGQLLALFQKVFLMIDGLDEQDVLERRELLHFIFQVQQSTPSTKIFATSRPIPEIREEFIRRGAIEMEIQASEEDIAIYLQAKMHRLPVWVQRVPNLIEETVDSITGASRGMFLLAYLFFESLLHKVSLKAFKRALGDLPTSLSAAYQQTEQRILRQNSDHCSLTQVVLEWIAYTTRIITVSELRTAVSLGITGETLDDIGLPEIDTIVSVCCGVIEVDQTTQTIRYVHYTAKQYFEESLDKHKSQEIMAAACLAYLSLNVFAVGACSDDESFELRLQS